MKAMTMQGFPSMLQLSPAEETEVSLPLGGDRSEYLLTAH